MAYLEIIALFWLIGVLTAMEMATFSARKERMHQAAASGDRRGTMVNAFQRAPADYLSAIQLVGVCANFVIGALLASSIESPTRAMLNDWLPGFRYQAELSWAIAIGSMTILAVIFTNILPKHIGFVRANEIALKTAPIMWRWIRIASPLTHLIRVTTKWLARLIRVAPDERFRVTERDIETLLIEGAKAGSLDKTEQEIMRRALRLSDSSVRDAMVRRESILWVDISWPNAKVEKFFRQHGRSNYPVCDGAIDRLRGTIRVQDFYLKESVQQAMTPPVFATPRDSLLEALAALRPTSTRLLMVKDGARLVGVLTLNDVLSHIVGPVGKA